MTSSSRVKVEWLGDEKMVPPFGLKKAGDQFFMNTGFQYDSLKSQKLIKDVTEKPKSKSVKEV